MMKVKIISDNYKKFEAVLPLYLESLIGHEDFHFERLDYGIDYLNNDKNSFVVIVTAQKIDFDRVSKKHSVKPTLEESKIFWEQIKELKTVLVKSSETLNYVELFLTSESKSGGGNIKQIKKIENSNGDENLFLVEFEDDSTFERVMEKLKTNDHKAIKIQPFFDDINEFENKIKESIKSIKLLVVTEFPISLIIKLPIYLETFKIDLEKLSNNDAIVRRNMNKDQVEIEYLPAKLSEKQLDEFVDRCTEKYKFLEWQIDKDRDIIKIQETLKLFYQTSNNILLICEKINEETLKIRIEGSEEIINTEKMKIYNIIGDEKNKKIEDTVKDKSYKCSLLMKNDFIKECKNSFSDIKIIISPPKETIHFTGFIQSILFCKQKMFEFFNKINKFESNISFMMAYFLHECRDYVESIIEENEMKCEYVLEDFDKNKTDLNSSYKLAFFSFGSARELEETKNLIIIEKLLEFKYNVTRESEKLLVDLYPQFLNDFNAELRNSKNDNKFLFLPKESNKVWCVGERKLVQDAEKRLVKFFEENTILDYYFDEINQEDLIFFKIVKIRQINNFVTHNCKIEFENEQNSNNLRLKIKANKFHYQSVKNELKNMLNKKIIVYYKTERCILDLYTKDKTKRILLDNIELKNRCLIRNDSKIEDYPVKENEIIVETEVEKEVVKTLHKEIKLKDFKTKLVICEKKIEEISNADVVVLPFTTNFEPSSSSATYFLNSSNSFAKEIESCKQHSYGEGEIHLLKLNKNKDLAFANIIIAFIPNITKKSEKRDKELQIIISRSLEKASSSHLKSILFPLFYSETGKNEQIERFIGTFFRSTINYLQENPKCNLNEIQFADPQHHVKFSNLCDSILTEIGLEFTKKDITSLPIIKKSDNERKISTNIEIKHGSILDNLGVDVIVNTTSEDLNLKNGAVSKLILAQAGDKIQQELNKSYKNGLKNHSSRVAISSGGNIKNFKKIFHVSLKSFEAKPEIEKLFKDVLKEILELCDQNEFNSIAMPAFGTGVLGYPKELVAEWMFKTTNEYLLENKNSCIEKVLFVLYDKDTETIKAFEDYSKKYDKNHFDEEDALNESEYEELKNIEKENDFFSDLNGNPTNGYKMKFKNVSVHVYLGDITKAREDVIINPTRNDFNLNGFVSKALIQGAGDGLRKELDQSRKLDTDGTCFTTAGNLNAKKILHASIGDANDIEKCVIKALYKINEERFESVVFPVIGTGNMQNDPKYAINKMFLGFAYYINNVVNKNKNSIKKIKVCIYEKQADMLNAFYEEMKELERTKKSHKSFSNWLGNIISKMGSYLISKKDEEDDEPKVNPQNYTTDTPSSDWQIVNKCQFRFKLISDSNECITNTKNELNEIFQNEMSVKSFDHDYVAKLERTNCEEIERLCNKFDIKLIKIDVELKRIKLSGLANKLFDCYTKVFEYLNESEKDYFYKYRLIQWEYSSNNINWTAFERYLNSDIENAKQKMEKSFEFSNENGEKVFIEFGTNAQYKKVPKQKMYSIRRVDLKVIPDWWIESKTLDLIPIDIKSQEYQNVLNIVKNNKFDVNHTIVSIERIQNERLYIQYKAHKKSFEDRRDPNAVNEKDLFHGTTGDTVESIWKQGFNRGYCGKNATG